MVFLSILDLYKSNNLFYCSAGTDSSAGSTVTLSATTVLSASSATSTTATTQMSTLSIEYRKMQLVKHAKN